MQTQSTKVLVVGGGLVGLSAAMFLAWRGVETVLVERHAGSSPHPRALGFMTRTAELYRAIGLTGLPQIPPGVGRPRRIAVESLAGKWLDEVVWSPPQAGTAQAPPSAAGRIEYSPCTGVGLAQDKLEPVLRDKAVQLGVDLRLATQMISFEHDGAGVTAIMRKQDGSEYALQADYMVAADGHASPVREALGVGRSGLGYVGTADSVLFRAPLDQYLEAGFSQFDINQPDMKARLVTYRDGRWALMFEDEKDRDQATLMAHVRQAIGRSDLDVEFITTGRWVLNALIADTFGVGRIFIVGDAAHAFPPARGGYGANTGIEDAHNLAWKLASVVSGVSTPALLDTYDAERRPIAWLRHGQIFNRQDYALVARPGDKDVPLIDDDAMELGQLYRSAAVIGAGEDLPAALRPEQWAGQPGTRAPHFWVTLDGARVSTLDVLQRNWVLLTEDSRWCAVAAGEPHGVKVECVVFAGTAAIAARRLGPPPADDGTLTLDTAIEQIASNPEGAAILDAIFPGLAGHATFDRFKTMTLPQLQPMSQGLITDERLARAQTALALVKTEPPPTDPNGVDAFAQALRTAFGLRTGGASLVRPDGYVAWRAVDMPDDPAAALAGALKQVAATVR